MVELLEIIEDLALRKSNVINSKICFCGTLLILLTILY